MPRKLPQRLRTVLTALSLMCLTSLFPSAGCPNGCARPYMAELGFVGDGPNSYQVRFCTSHMGVVQPVCSKQEMLLPLQLDLVQLLLGGRLPAAA